MKATTAVRLRAGLAQAWVALLAGVQLSFGSTVLTFDDLSPGTDSLLIPNGYGGLTWSNFYAYNGSLRPSTEGYRNGVVSSPNIAYNGFANPASFNCSSPIDLNSAYLTAAFDNGLQVRVQGVSGTNLIYDNTYVLNLNAPTLINFNYLQIDKVLFESTPARNFVIDDLSISSTNPIAIFATLPNSGHLPLTVQFIDQSTGTMTNWDWDFGDGTAHGKAQNPTHTYYEDGIYSVTLRATASGAVASTNTRTISVIPAASFSAVPDPATSPLTIHFADESTGSIASWDWYFGDGGHSTDRNPMHTYGKSGTFDVVLFVRDNAGLTDRTNIPVTLSPLFAANPSAGFLPLTVQFTYQSSAAVTNWDWDFGDGSAHSSAQSPSHTYNTNGVFLVTLTITGTNGIRNSDNKQITVASALVCTAPASSPLLPGMAKGWGCNNFGQINTGCITNIIAFAAGLGHSLFLLEDQTVIARGGYDGDGSPVLVPPGLSNVVAVAAGQNYSLVLKSDGTVFGWNQSGPVSLPSGLTNIVAISAGVYHSLALKADGTVVGWGTTSLPSGLSNIVAVSAGRGLSLALKDDGSVVGWDLGRGADPSNLRNIVAISAADDCCYEAWEALGADGIVYAGSAFNNSWGSTGIGSVVAISASRGDDGHISWALRWDGTIVAIPAGFSFCGGPFLPPDPPNNVVAVASGDAHNLALIGDAPPGPLVQKTALQNPGWENGVFSVSVPTQNGRVYRLEFTKSLADSNWVGLPLVPGNGHVQTFEDPNASGSQRFYRVRRW